MLKRYQPKSLEEQEQALREIMQEIALVGLWRSKFFEHAAFYGGTALRIFYGLDRFSEDLDFTLMKPNPRFSWDKYGEAIKQELNSYGFQVDFIEKAKAQESQIKSAFLKTNTLQELLNIGVSRDLISGLHKNTLMRIKVEIDTEPSVDFDYEQKILDQPVPVSVRCVNEEHLFAAKMHAALFRAWKGRVKGRDWYDIVWFIRNKSPLNLEYFSRHRGLDASLTQEEFLKMAHERVDNLDVASALKDAVVFSYDPDLLTQTWSKEFFHTFLNKISFKA